MASLVRWKIITCLLVLKNNSRKKLLTLAVSEAKSDTPGTVLAIRQVLA